MNKSANGGVGGGVNRGFVFGKFYPFHKGHQALVDYALNHCDTLYIIVCASDKEAYSASVRSAWIKNSYAAVDNITLVEFDYKESELPNSSTSSVEISKLWAAQFSAMLPEMSVVITSETYGDFVAKEMGIKHQSFDPTRQSVAICASAIRGDLSGHWSYLPDSVKAFFQKTVGVLGTESSGKTSLVKLLAREYNALAVYEAGRDIIEDSNNFDVESLVEVADEHAERILSARKSLAPLIFVDTDVYTTISYARFCLSKDLVLSPKVVEESDFDLRFYLNNDVPHVQDGTRLDKSNRDKLHVSHLKTLSDYQIGVVKISGDWDSRLLQARRRISALINFYPD